MTFFSLLKMLMFFLNSLIFFGGLGLLAIGLCLKMDGTLLTEFLSTKIEPLSQLNVIRNLCIIIGSILLFLGILGCWGAIKENRGLLLLFFIIILIIFLVKIASIVIILLFSSVVNALFLKFDTWVVKTLQKSYDTEEKITKTWNTTMRELYCCGFHNYTDFTDSNYNNKSGGLYPSFCCKNNKPCNETYINTMMKGCLYKLKETLKINGNLIGGIALGISGFEVAAMIISMILFFKINEFSYD